MKTQQDLVVEFDDFPKEVAQILNNCIDHSLAKKSGGQQYFATFEIEQGAGMGLMDALEASDNQEIPHVDHDNGLRRFVPKAAVLKVFERGTFKNLLHLHLEFNELDDFSIKQIMIERIDRCHQTIDNLHSVIDEKDAIITKLNSIVFLTIAYSYDF